MGASSNGSSACALVSTGAQAAVLFRTGDGGTKDESVPMKRVRRVVDRWVYGPNPKYQLEAGESELVTKVVWVQVPMW